MAMTDDSLRKTLKIINTNINVQRRNHPDSAEATGAREENRRYFALLDSHGINPTAEWIHEMTLRLPGAEAAA